MTHQFQFRIFLAGALLLAMAAAIPVRGQTPAPEDLTRGVARISLMDGEVSVRRGDSGEWVAGVLNAPLMTDDRIATGQNSRAEVQFDSANLLRMGGNAEIHLALLENGKYHVEVARGTLTFRKLRQARAEIELNTPSVSVRPTMPGTVRLNVTEANESEITARPGDVEVFTPQGTQWIYAGQTMMARGSAADPEFQMEQAIPEDDWDRWNEGRDRSMGSDNSAQYVPAGVDGTSDLDAAGTWVYVAPYGYVWRPVGMAAGWAPYRNGRWVWLNWYGWTWVSYDPWGWAPYHYGRWFFDTRWGWAWYPGALGVTAYWSPALVGFFGYGHGGIGVGIGAGFGFANVGWVPLAPFEPFHRWWGPGYAGGFNRGLNVTGGSVTAVYRNARVSNGVSGLAAGDFAAGRFNAVQRVNGAQMQSASLVQGRLALNPSVANRRFSDRAVASIPRPAANTHFYSGGAGGADRPVGNRQAAAGYHRFGEPGRAAQNARTPQSAANPGQRPGILRRFGEPGAGQSTPRNERPPAARGGGWKSFGQPGVSSGGRQPYNPPPNRPSAGPAPRSAPPRGGGGGGHAAPRGGGGRR